MIKIPRSPPHIRIAAPHDANIQLHEPGSRALVSAGAPAAKPFEALHTLNRKSSAIDDIRNRYCPNKHYWATRDLPGCRRSQGKHVLTGRTAAIRAKGDALPAELRIRRKGAVQ